PSFLRDSTHRLPSSATLHTSPPSTFFFLYSDLPHHYLHSFPTRRSSDLSPSDHPVCAADPGEPAVPAQRRQGRVAPDPPTYVASDRKSTRLNSSHVSISYAVFCLKKKKITAR